MAETLWQLALVMGKLGLLSIGGSSVVLAEMERDLVGHGWMTHQQFVEAFAIGQLAPGVGSMYVLPVGYQVAGFVGALVAVVSYFGPTALLAVLAARAWHRVRESPWCVSLRVGVTPIALGLILASAFVLGRAAVHNVAGALILGSAVTLVVRTNLNVLLVLAMALLAGAAFLRP